MSFWKKAKDDKKLIKNRVTTGKNFWSYLNRSFIFKVFFNVVYLYVLTFILCGCIWKVSGKVFFSKDIFYIFVYLISVQIAIELYLYLFEKEIFKNNKKELLLKTIVLLTIFFQSMFLNVPVFAKHEFIRYVFIAPAGIMLMSLFFPVRLAFFYSFVIAVYMSFLDNLVPESFYIIPVICVFSAFFIKDVRNRYQITKAGIYLAGITFLMEIIGLFITSSFNLNKISLYAEGAVVTGALTIFSNFTFPYVLESVFREITNIGLLELSDLNHKLLKNLLMVAPGTYHHSITVANIAEAAAEAIGARSLLVRVMGYYHDIGKLVKPEYFSENEIGGKSIHSKLSPTMSSLIIISHVKNGVEIAKKYKLPKVIIDGIREHHGTSLVYYFYKKALEDAKTKDSVKEENFRYPGPKPQSRETAILSIADTVEAASRSLSEPSPSRIKGLVYDLLKDKYASGELDECNLTFRELKIIREVIIRVLTARFHTRPVYPDKNNPSQKV